MYTLRVKQKALTAEDTGIPIQEVKRSSYTCFHLVDGRILDPSCLLNGATELTYVNYIMAASALTCQTYMLDPDDFHFLTNIPSDDWTPVANVMAKANVSSPHDRLGKFAYKGLVVTDAAHPHLRRIREREEALSHNQWHPYSAAYHMMSKWENVRVCSEVEAADAGKMLEDLRTFGGKAFESFVNAYGNPPPAFYEREDKKSVTELPLFMRDTGIFSTLMKRRTKRTFEREQPLSLEAFSLLLYYVYGCHGYARLSEACTAIKRTSPSGGGLHPIEAYPLIRNVEGIAAGLYHYNMQYHALELIEALDADEVSMLADTFTAGQLYPRDAHVLFVMTARFYRNHWKYRKNPRTYGVILMDAAHLSQTLYLVAAELGLGAFVTAAINSLDIEARLCLDGYAESAIAICGAGVPAKTGCDPEFLPYIPRETLV